MRHLQVHSIEDRDEALKHDRGYIGKRYVTVRVASEQAKQDSIAKSGVQVISHLTTNPIQYPLVVSRLASNKNRAMLCGVIGLCNECVVVFSDWGCDILYCICYSVVLSLILWRSRGL